MIKATPSPRQANKAIIKGLLKSIRGISKEDVYKILAIPPTSFNNGQRIELINYVLDHEKVFHLNINRAMKLLISLRKHSNSKRSIGKYEEVFDKFIKEFEKKEGPEKKGNNIYNIDFEGVSGEIFRYNVNTSTKIIDFQKKEGTKEKKRSKRYYTNK